jgi:hypothetical protein
MTFAYDYPLWSLMISMFWFFLLIVWIMILIHVFADIFRSHDLGGGAKALWTIFVIFLPFLGVFVYLIARGHKMTEHELESAQKQQAAFDSYVKQTASAANPADQLTQLTALRDSGAITPEEFAAGKAKILS